MTPSFNAKQILGTLFRQQPCWQIVALARELDYSIPSVRRFLAQVGYYSSFTHNGQWYTLSSIPRFGADGLWFHHDIGFSRAGSLTQTLIALIARSPSGMTAEELGQKLRCRCHTILVQLYRKGRLQRQKVGRSYRYLDADPGSAKKQIEALHPTPLPAEIAVFILAEFIREPTADFRQLAKRLSLRTGFNITADQVQALFERHGLKKTTYTARPLPSTS